MYRGQLLLQGFTYDSWSEDPFDYHRELTAIAVLARQNALDLGSRIAEIYTNARSEEHATKLVEALKSMYLIGHDARKKVKQAEEHAEFIKLMSEGIQITPVGSGPVTGRIVKIDRNTGKEI